jgi:hypothetical protein
VTRVVSSRGSSRVPDSDVTRMILSRVSSRVPDGVVAFFGR